MSPPAVTSCIGSCPWELKFSGKSSSSSTNSPRWIFSIARRGGVGRTEGLERTGGPGKVGGSDRTGSSGQDRSVA